MIYAPKFNVKGEAGEKAALPKEVFEAIASPTLLSQAVRVYLGNQRRAQAKTKTRGEVAKTTAKMYRQKGTGRARHGSYSAPIFVGGGVAHGPTGGQNYKLKVSKLLTRKAILGALTARAGEKAVAVVAGMDKMSGKTAEAQKLRQKAAEGKNRILIVVTREQEKAKRAWRNLKQTEVADAGSLNAYSILKAKKLVIAEEAIEQLKKYAA